MKQMMFEFDSSKCISCGACAVACMDQNDIDVEVQVPFRHVHVLESIHDGTTEYATLSMACMHCADAPCVQACPAGCIKKDPETGLTVYDNTSCIGCHSCVMACPFGAPTFNTKGKMVKCDGCITRLENGLEPACVRGCPFDALKLVPVENVQQNQWNNVLKRIEKIAQSRG